MRPVLLGEAMVNIDMLCLKGLIEQNYFEDAKPSKDVLPLFSGSIELVKENNVVIVVVVFMFSFSFYFFFFQMIGDLLFFFNLRLTGLKFRTLHHVIQPHCTHESLQLSVKDRIFISDGKNAQKEKDGHGAAAATAAVADLSKDSGVSFMLLPKDIRGSVKRFRKTFLRIKFFFLFFSFTSLFSGSAGFVEHDPYLQEYACALQGSSIFCSRKQS